MTTLNLPRPPTPFVGRTEEQAEIAGLLADPDCRLLTLVGPGGIGKTRLALEAAAQLTFADGIAFTALQPLNSPEFIVPSIAESLHVQFSMGREPKQQLLDYLCEKSLLLVLDNFEHLLDGAELVSEILAYAPGVRVMATTREALNLQEEWVYLTKGMSVPQTIAEENVANFGAVRLFMQCARRMRTDFALEDEQAEVIRICQLVEGMPLGLELAAAWVRALSCKAIADEISRSLEILGKPARNGERRHRNMRAAFEPTWNRMTEQEREVFQKLSVFHGGFTRGAAEAVAGASLCILSALVDKSMIRVDTNGHYDVHELLRQYGEEHLNAAPTKSAWVHDLHCAYYAEFLYQQVPFLKGRRIKEALNEISGEIDNVRAAWQWATGQGKEDTIAKAADGLHLFYHIRGWLHEGEQAFGKAVVSLTPAGLEQKPGLILARMLALHAAFLCYARGRPREARRLLQDSLAILHQLKSVGDMALCFHVFAGVASVEGKYEETQRHLQQSLTLLTETGDRYWIAHSMGYLGYSYHLLGEDQEAKSLVQKSLALFQELESFYGFALMHLKLACIALALEEYEEARQLAERSLRAGQEIGFRAVISGAQIVLAEAACAVGDDEAAWHFARQAFHQFWTESRDIPGALWVFPTIANLFAKRGEIEQALELLTLAIHYPATHSEGRIRALHHLDKLLAMLPADEMRGAMERGKTLELEIAVQAILTRWAQVFKHDDSSTEWITAQSFAKLFTARELEVVALMADGLCNREIADELVLAVSTVKWYVKQIFSKLDVTSRTQAVARARLIGLIN